MEVVPAFIYISLQSVVAAARQGGWCVMDGQVKGLKGKAHNLRNGRRSKGTRREKNQCKKDKKNTSIRSLYPQSEVFDHSFFQNAGLFITSKLGPTRVRITRTRCLPISARFTTEPRDLSC